MSELQETDNVRQFASLGVIEGKDDSKMSDAQTVSPMTWPELLRWGFPRAVTIAFFAILMMWIYRAEGGMGLHFTSVFGLHAFFMSLFVLVFMQEGLLVFSAPLSKPCARFLPVWLVRKSRSGTFHAITQLLGMLFCLGGVLTCYFYKWWSPQPVSFPFYSLYSCHAWVGVSCMALVVLQFGIGIYTHTQTGLTPLVYMRYHRILGRAVYVLALATMAMGFQDMQSSDLAGSAPPWTNTTGFTQDEIDGMGYFPDSALSRYSAFACVLLIVQSFATFTCIGSNV